MSLNKIVAGDYGLYIKITVNDVDTEAAANLSAYTTSQHIYLKDPDGNIAELESAFETDGSDGVVQYQLADGDIDEAGTWYARVVVSATGKLSTEWGRFIVLA